MRLSHKLAKLGDPRTLQSAKRHLARAFFSRRPGSRLNARRILASIDREKFRQIYDQYAVKDPGIGWQKFLDLENWIPSNLERVRRLELDYGGRKSILDIGSGAGYFIYICQLLGHEALGLDAEGVPLYPEMARLLGLRRVIWRIEAFTPLPELGRKFDVISAFMICFDKYNDAKLWGVEEWDFFLEDLGRFLKPRGRIWLELNPRPDGTFTTEELRDLFERRGARVDRQKVIFRPARHVAAR